MAGFIVEKRHGSNGPYLVPIDQQGIDALAVVQNGKYVLIEPKLTRNPNQLRFFWSLVTIIFSHDDKYPSKSKVADDLKIAVGHFTIHTHRDGSTEPVPKSISFGSMDQESFTEFFNKVLDHVVLNVLPGTKASELKAELESMVGDRL